MAKPEKSPFWEEEGEKTLQIYNSSNFSSSAIYA